MFQPSADTLIQSTLVQFSTSAATLDIQPNILIDGTTKYLFVVMPIADSAQIGASLGIRVPSRTDVILADGQMVDSPSGVTTSTTLFSPARRRSPRPMTVLS